MKSFRLVNFRRLRESIVQNQFPYTTTCKNELKYYYFTIHSHRSSMFMKAIHCAKLKT